MEVCIDLSLLYSGYIVQEVFHSQWCVELWHIAAWDLVGGEEALQQLNQPSSTATIVHWLLPASTTWMS